MFTGSSGGAHTCLYSGRGGVTWDIPAHLLFSRMGYLGYTYTPAILEEGLFGVTHLIFSRKGYLGYTFTPDILEEGLLGVHLYT